MKDGYYLSTYLHIDELANLMHISVRHDQNIALWKKENCDIKLIHYWELERLTGLKHHRRSFYNEDHISLFINELLLSYDITIDDIIDIWGTPRLDTSTVYYEESPDNICYHSIAHLYSCIMLDTEKFYNEKIIGLSVDGAPDTVIETDAHEKDYYCGSYSDKGKLRITPVSSPALLWNFAKSLYGMEEGSLMAMAYASESRILDDEALELISIKNHGDVGVVMDYVKKLVNTVESFKQEEAGKLFNYFDNRFTEQENRISMVMKKIQELSIMIMDDNLKIIINDNKIDTSKVYLAISGGYGLNCCTNSYLLNKYKFKGLIAPPCINDTGQALGIGLYAFSKNIGKFNFHFKNAYYGDKDTQLQIVLKDPVYSRYIESIGPIVFKEAVNDITESPILWFDGRAEIGPRALGHRSLIADPRTVEAKDALNDIKQRQWWRPVAPIMLDDYLNEWFENAYESPFMLNTFQIKSNKKSLIKAIAHLDNSARIQTITKEDNEILFNLLVSFHEVTGVPILCNTSLNDKGEPIINTIQEAFNFALRENIKVIYVNGNRISLCNHSEYPIKEPLERNYKMDYVESDERQSKLDEYNPYNISKEILKYYYWRGKYKNKISLTERQDVINLMIAARVTLKYE